MTSLWFLGTAKTTQRSGMTWIESPITPESLPLGCYQRTRYNALKTQVLAEIVAPDGSIEEARAAALATVGITSEITDAEAAALIASGQYK